MNQCPCPRCRPLIADETWRTIHVQRPDEGDEDD